MIAAMLRPEALAVLISFNVGLIVGAGIAWSLIMFIREPVEPTNDLDLM